MFFSEEKTSSVIYPNYCWAFPLFTCLPVDVFPACVAHLLLHPQPRVARVTLWLHVWRMRELLVEISVTISILRVTQGTLLGGGGLSPLVPRLKWGQLPVLLLLPKSQLSHRNRVSPSGYEFLGRTAIFTNDLRDVLTNSTHLQAHSVSMESGILPWTLTRMNTQEPKSSWEPN